MGGGVVQEIASEKPSKIGTIYRSQGNDGSWIELEINDIKNGRMFEMRKSGDTHYIKYTFTPKSDMGCELEYTVRVDDGDISERFSSENIIKILAKLKYVVEMQ